MATVMDASEEQSRMPTAFAAGVVVVLLALGGLFWITRSTRSAGQTGEQHLPFGAAEQQAAQHIHFLDLKLSQATNLLNQEFTYVSGILSNDGSQTLRDVEVTLEFRDSLNQVVLRESRTLFGPRSQPLYGGQHRDFEITLDSVPAVWNQQYPSIRVSGLALE
ncbi:MAG: hypothetical protein WBC04_11080 [Candidatus Acidiferrales bacterium]